MNFLTSGRWANNTQQLLIRWLQEPFTAETLKNDSVETFK